MKKRAKYFAILTIFDTIRIYSLYFIPMPHTPSTVHIDLQLYIRDINITYTNDTRLSPEDREYCISRNGWMGYIGWTIVFHSGNQTLEVIDVVDFLVPRICHYGILEIEWWRNHSLSFAQDVGEVIFTHHSDTEILISNTAHYEWPESILVWKSELITALKKLSELFDCCMEDIYSGTDPISRERINEYRQERKQY
jgi:hypothetical protein